MKKATLKGIIVLLLAGIITLTAGIGSSWFTNGNIKTWFNSWGKDNQSIEQTGNVDAPDAPDMDYTETPDGSTVIGSEDNGIQLLSAVLPRAAYAANGVAETADSAYSLTAEIKPDYATDKTVDWSVDWSDSESEWASGKTVTDYVTVKPTTDGALTAVATCLQDFGEPIILTVSSRSKPEVSGICIMGYYQRVKSVNYKFSFDSGEYTPTISNGVYMVDYTGAEKDYAIELEPIYSNYTVADTYTTKISGAFSSTFGYSTTQTLNTLKISAGIAGGDPVISKALSTWLNTVYALPTLSGYGLQSAYESAKKGSDLTTTDRQHPKYIWYYAVFSELNITASNAFLPPDYISRLDAYTPAAYNLYGAQIASYSDFVAAVKKCNSGKVGVIQYTIKFVGTHSEINATLNLSYNDDFKVDVSDVVIPDSSMTF